MAPASFATDSYSPDNLLAGPAGELIDRKVTLLSGQNLVRGALLGRVTVGTPTAAAFAVNAVNTGTLGSLVIGTAAKVGVYRVVIIEPGSNAGKFSIEDPDGITLGTGTVAVAFTAPGSPSFTIADGATDFIAGEGFDITVAAGSGKYKSSVAAATDGSQVPDAVLAEDQDASSGDKEALIYTAGIFNEGALVLGAGHTADSIREGLRVKGIHLKTVQGA